MAALALGSSSSLLGGMRVSGRSKNLMDFRVLCGPRVEMSGALDEDGHVEFPSFLPKEIHKIKDPFARTLAQKIQRLPVQVESSEFYIMSSCVKPTIQSDTNPVVLLHSFDSSCLEWRRTYPLLEDAGLETWAIDILGWGFSDLALKLDLCYSIIPVLERLPPCNAASKRYHLYQLWRTHIKRPMILVGPSLGAAVAIDFAVNFPEAVDRLILIGASVYVEGTGLLRKLPRILAYAMVSLLKSTPLRLYANSLTFDDISLSTSLDWANVARLHCLLPWWEDATVNFMLSGGYNVVHQIKKVKQKTFIIWGQQDNIISNKLAVRLKQDLPNAIMHQIPDCGHLPHVEKPETVANLIIQFARDKVTAKERD